MVCREPRSILSLEEILHQKSMHIIILTRRSRRAFLTSLEQHLMFLDTNYPVEKKSSAYRSGALRCLGKKEK